MSNKVYINSANADNQKSIQLEPIVMSGRSFGIKLLSVYEFLKCDLACRNLVDKLTNQGFDANLCKKICEQACIISLCLYNKENERVFMDGLSVIMTLTPEELKSTYSQYENLAKKAAKFNKSSLEKIDYIKKNYIKNLI